MAKTLKIYELIYALVVLKLQLWLKNVPNYSTMVAGNSY